MSAEHQVSVVIPAYNSARDLPRAIDSVLCQDVDGLEVLVVDDGSIDETGEIVKRWAGRVQYHRQPNGGPSAARNVGIRLTSGRFVAFLDADDFWLPGKLRLQVDEMKRRPEVKLLGCGARVQDRHGRILREVVRGNFPTPYAMRRVLSIAQAIPGSASAALVDRRTLEELGGFDESLRIGEDWDLWLRIVDRHEAAFVERVLVVITAGEAKPGWRSLEHEIAAVSRVIEKNIPSRRRGRAYAALHARIGIAYLSHARRGDAARHLWRSIRLRPLNLYPLDPRHRFMFPRPARYRLLLKALLGRYARPAAQPQQT